MELIEMGANTLRLSGPVREVLNCIQCQPARVREVNEVDSLSPAFLLLSIKMGMQSRGSVA